MLRYFTAFDAEHGYAVAHHSAHGGPVAIMFTPTQESAEREANRLNLSEQLKHMAQATKRRAEAVQRRAVRYFEDDVYA